MKSGNLTRLDPLHLFEVDEWDILGTKNPVKFEKIEGTAQDVTLRCCRVRRLQLRFAGKKDLWPYVRDAKICSPIVRLYHVNHCISDGSK
jgi:hypothetical protein